MQTPDLETPEYTILYKSPDFEVRKYASYLVAETPMARGAGPNSGSGFNELAGYIFGGNQDSQSLEMTTPVFSKPASKASDSPTMQFVMERRFSSPESLPKPTGSAKISPKVEQGGILAATTFSGWPGHRGTALHAVSVHAALDARANAHVVHACRWWQRSASFVRRCSRRSCSLVRATCWRDTTTPSLPRSCGATKS
jgi:hypothetical protein